MASKHPRTEQQKRREAAQMRARRIQARLAKEPLPARITDRTDAYGRQLFGQMPTERELIILSEVFIHGDQTAAGECLGITTTTIKNQCTSLYGKLGAQSMSQAAVYLGWIAFPRGLVKPHRKPLEPVVIPDVEKF